MTPLPPLLRLQNNFSPRRILSNLPQAAGAAGGQGNAATPSPGSSPAPTSSSTTPSPTWTRWAREASPRTCTSLKHISIHVIHLQLIIIMKQTRLVSNLYQSLNHFVYCVMHSDVLSIVAENSLFVKICPKLSKITGLLHQHVAVYSKKLWMEHSRRRGAPSVLHCTVRAGLQSGSAAAQLEGAPSPSPPVYASLYCHPIYFVGETPHCFKCICTET